MHVVVVGNGVVGLMIVREILGRVPDAQISLVAPAARPGCASVAAAAMFNSFAELDAGTLDNKFDKERWLFNRAAAPRWPEILSRLGEESEIKVEAGFGTYVVNNHVSDELEDRNFDMIVQALQDFQEPHELVSPRDIPNYKPECGGRATRSVYIPREGWVNPVQLVAALSSWIARTGRVKFVDTPCDRLETGRRGIKGVHTDDGRTISGDVYILSPGANFTRIIEKSGLDVEFPKVFYGVGCTILLKTDENTLKNCVRTPNRGLACGIYSAPRDPSHTIIGASNFISPVPAENARATSVYTLLKSAMEQINHDYYRAELVKVNVGWRPTSEDTLPLVGATELENLFVATGTKRDGLHCSPLIAECITDLITTGRSSYPIDLFRPDRIPYRIYSREEAINTTVRHTMNAAFQHDFVPAKNRMIEEMERFHRQELEALHDKLGAVDWGIPPELVQMYRFGHIAAPCAEPHSLPKAG